MDEGLEMIGKTAATMHAPAMPLPHPGGKRKRSRLRQPGRCRETPLMVSRRFHVHVFSLAVLFAALYTAEGWMFKDYNLDMFQVANGYLKDCDDALYPVDFIWSKADMIANLHVNVRRLMWVTDALTLGRVREPIDLFLLWLPVGFLLFFTGNYLLALRFSGDQRAALLVACAFMVVRRTIWDWWGIGPTFTMSARGPVLSLLPLAFWAFLKCDGKLRRLGAVFFCWGLVCNLHPLSGWGFVEFLGIAILITERFRARAWLKVLVMGCAMMLGSVPFLLVWAKVTIVPESLRASPDVVRQFWDYYTGLTPSFVNYLIGFLEDLVIPLGLAGTGVFLWRRNRGPADRQLEMKLSWVFPGVVIGMVILIIGLRYVMKGLGIPSPVMIAEHARNLKMIYLVLPIWMGLAFAAWFQWRSRASALLRWGPPALLVFLALTINFPGHKWARQFAWIAGWLPGQSARKLEADLRNDAADLEVARWAREQTSPAALFYFDSYEFRYYSRRSLVFCWFDRPCVAFHPTREMEEWLHRRDRIQPLKLARDGRGMLDLAREYQADYLVTLRDWLPPQQVPVWSNWKYSVYDLRAPP